MTRSGAVVDTILACRRESEQGSGENSRLGKPGLRELLGGGIAELPGEVESHYIRAALEYLFRRRGFLRKLRAHARVL